MYREKGEIRQDNGCARSSEEVNFLFAQENHGLSSGKKGGGGWANGGIPIADMCLPQVPYGSPIKKKTSIIRTRREGGKGFDRRYCGKDWKKKRKGKKLYLAKGRGHGSGGKTKLVPREDFLKTRMIQKGEGGVH